jgi:glutamate formiminotransferase
MEDCIEIAREFADRLATELSVPVYLYGEAQTREYRRDLSQIRDGEYEALYNKVGAQRNTSSISNIALIRFASKSGALTLVTIEVFSLIEK